MPTISFEDATIDCSEGQPLLRSLPAGATSLDRFSDKCGFGICGKCVVRVDGDVNDPTERERTRLSDDELDADVRMACQTRVYGDVRVSRHRELEGTDSEDADETG